MTELVLPITMPGLTSVPIQAEVTGELTLAELQAAQEQDGPTVYHEGPVKRIAERHRALARAIAGGMTNQEASAVFDLGPKTIDNLRVDPAFKNLVSFYTRSDDEVFRTTQERLADVTNSAIDAIEEKLEDPEERKKVPLPQLVSIVTMGADRTGNGPQSTSVSVNIHTNLADRMKAARERAQQAMIDVTPSEAAE